MQLVAPAGPDALSLELDLANGPMARRVRGARRDEPLPRAVGLHRRPERPEPLAVVDATAGLGRDALVLAQLGCAVTAIERVPALALLVQDAVDGSWLAGRVHVVCADSAAWLEHRDGAPAPHVICLDPMFEEQGRAQVKKEMQVCRALADPPDDAEELLHVALRVARERVVVKRGPGAAPLAPGVAFAVPGERVRFDVYLTGPR
jgi:16S rRNA (guanine1516-N2)-methyltransferase